MFDKSKKNIKKINIRTSKLYKDKEILLTNSFIEMMSNYHSKTLTNEKNDYQNEVTSYINRKHEMNVKKQYNPKIVELYKNGCLVINNNEYLLKDFFIVFDDKLNNFNIKCINSKYNNKEINYNKAVRYIDTTAFINLIKDNKTSNNKLIIDNQDILDDNVSKWDGYIHSEVLETDAISNKLIIRGDNHE